MILGRFLGGYIAASRGHGKEAHEVPSGPPIKVEVNALILFQLLYVHYAASDSCLSVFCACSFQLIGDIVIFMRSNLIKVAFFVKSNTWSFFCHSELELGHDESAPTPLIQPAICFGMCVFSTLC